MEIETTSNFHLPNTPEEYKAIYDLAKVRPENKSEVGVRALLLSRYKESQYTPVASAVGCPWWVPALIHNEECGDDVGVFKAYLHNGDPMFDHQGHPIKTMDVPAGKGPFASWSVAAIDALGGDGAYSQKAWDIGSALRFFEHYNGMGYHNHGVASPYVWGMTDQYTKGHYHGDGNWRPNEVSKNYGCAAILKALEEMNLI